jgi:hypothetical protein
VAPARACASPFFWLTPRSLLQVTALKLGFVVDDLAALLIDHLSGDAVASSKRGRPSAG